MSAETDLIIPEIPDTKIDWQSKFRGLEQKIALYEENGGAKLYYSLQRKMNEMAQLMNNTNLITLDIDDPKAKTFDRLKVIWQDAASIAQAVKELGSIAGITGDEKKDVEKKPFNDRLAESRT
jgi:hypothetical protein